MRDATAMASRLCSLPRKGDSLTSFSSMTCPGSLGTIYLMLSVLAELHFEGGAWCPSQMTSTATMRRRLSGFRFRGIFNELQLRDLKKKTLRGQIGQKRRGFSVGERTYGYKSVPVGTIQMDKKGRPRPEGYKMEVEPREAAQVLRIFKAYADGYSMTRIVRMLNEESIPGRIRASKGWSPATVSRLLDNDKYIGKWVWNKTESRRDTRTGRRRRFQKPELEWIVHEDESLRIVPKDLWDRVRTRRESVRRSFPGGKGRKGFSKEQGSRQTQFPTHLLSGTMTCGECGAAIAQVSGKSGGYYGCLGAAKGACENKMLVRRTLVEKIILTALRERLSSPENVQHVLERVEEEVKQLYAHIQEIRHPSAGRPKMPFCKCPSGSGLQVLLEPTRDRLVLEFDRNDQRPRLVLRRVRGLADVVPSQALVDVEGSSRRSDVQDRGDFVGHTCVV